MKSYIKYVVLAGLGMFLLPLGLTALMSGREAIAVEKQMDMEAYLPAILCREIPWDYEEETLKAQAVLARSSLYFYAENGNTDIPEGDLEEFIRESKNGDYKKALERMEKAVKVTKGEVMICGGEICQGIFHRVSSGRTRDAKEVLSDGWMSFLKSVDSSQDIGSEEYLHGHYFTEEALRERIKEKYPEALTDNMENEPPADWLEIVKRDSQEYILSIRVGSLTVSGEGFRRNMELSSSNFTIQKLDGKIRFLCKGLGHGLGLSQYGANELAKKGKTYKEIIFTYFPDVILQRK
jgi:stage II sporulation protein D